MIRLFTLFTLMLSTQALADAPVGDWAHGDSALSVSADGTFGWATSSRVTDGEWKATGALMSLDSDTSKRTYAYAVTRNTLTLTDTSGGRLVFERQTDKRKGKR